MDRKVEEMEGKNFLPGNIKIERSERAKEQAQVVSELISELNIEKKQCEELLYQLSKLLLFTEMDCAVEGYIKGVEVARADEAKEK